MPVIQKPRLPVLRDNMQIINFERRTDSVCVKVANLEKVVNFRMLSKAEVEDILHGFRQVPKECIAETEVKFAEREYILDGLTDRQRKIVKMRYPVAFGEIGEVMGVNQIARTLGINGRDVDEDLEAIDKALGLSKN